MEFFQEFNFDTVLAIISCITGIIALFLGGIAYKNCKVNKNTVKQKKKFKDNSADNSVTVGGDYTHNEGVSETALISVVEQMRAMTNESFSVAIDGVYTMFQAKCDDNLHTIVEKTEQIIKEQKLTLGGYSKIDWIHVYFESAKNTSNTYMQDVWAKVLARELSAPGSFSFKTLGVLKNMTDEDFHLFEKLCSLQNNGTILQGYDTEAIIEWTNQIKLSEMGLLNLNNSKRWYVIEPNKENSIPDFDRRLAIVLRSKIQEEVNIEYHCYFLSCVAIELLNIASYTPSNEYFRILYKTLKKDYEKTADISMHQIIYGDETGYRYSKEAL